MTKQLSPYEAVWLKPKRVFERIRDEGPGQELMILPLVILSMILSLEVTLRNQPFLSINSVWMFLGFGVIAFLVMVVLIFVVQPWLITGAGRIFDGQASHRQIANVLAVSTIPLSAVFTYQILALCFGAIPSIQYFQGRPILQLWTIGLTVYGIGICQRMPVAFSLVSLFLAELPFLVLAFWMR
ncbi:MAG: YIP1 family protein [Bacteroidota bacterium]